jgi:PadR family transcriptional regulator, regulatory protein PadR
MALAKKETTELIHSSIEDHSKLFRDLLLGFVKVHVLYHASREPVYGVGIGAELDQHGYRLSPGTLYPLLHTLETAGFLQRENHVVEGKVRKYYEITELGQRALAEARLKIVELVQEIVEDDGEPTKPAKAKAKSGRK